MTDINEDDDGPPVESDWGRRVAATVGSQVAHYRKLRKPPPRGMSAQQLSEATAALGYHVTRSNIANLESGRRPFVSLPEVIVLARALDVPPVMLMYPIGAAIEVEALPDDTVDIYDAYQWFTGVWPLGNHRDAEADRRYRKAANPIGYLRLHYKAVMDCEFSDDDAREKALDSLRELRGVMEGNGEVLPPLPPEIEKALSGRRG